MSGWEIPRHWRLNQQRYGLVGGTCQHCDAKIFPPRDVCPDCGVGGLVGLGMLAQATNGEKVERAALVVLAFVE